MAMATVDRTTECGEPALGVEGLDLQLGPIYAPDTTPECARWRAEPRSGQNFGARGSKRHHPDRFDGLSARLGAPVSRRSPRNQALRGP